MQSGELAIGIMSRVMRGTEMAAVAKSAGFDCHCIDQERNSFSLEAVGQLSITATALEVTPIVQVPGLGPDDTSRTLESGAQGIIIPHTLFRGGPAAEILENMHEATPVIVMIESVNAVQNAGESASVEGIDMLLVGANDLCSSLEFPGQHYHPEVRSAYGKVAEASHKQGKFLGVGGQNSHPEISKDMIKLGACYVSAGSDTDFLMTADSEAANIYL